MNVIFSARYVLPLALIVLICSISCAGNPNANATPQAVFAHHAASVLDAVTALQRGVTASATISPSFVPTARQITAVVERVHSKSVTLGQALRAYDAAITLDLRNAAEADVLRQIADINVLLVEMLHIKIDDPTGQQISALISNVAAVVSTLSAELARVRAL